MGDLFAPIREIHARRMRREAWKRRIGCVVAIIVMFGMGLAFVWAAAQVWKVAQ